MGGASHNLVVLGCSKDAGIPMNIALIMHAILNFNVRWPKSTAAPKCVDYSSEEDALAKHHAHDSKKNMAFQCVMPTPAPT